MQRIISILLLFLFCASINFAQVRFHWKFDENQDIEKNYGERWGNFTTKESITKSDFRIRGLTKYVPGVKGSAIKFDGFSSYIEGWVVPPEGSAAINVPSIAGNTFKTEEYTWEFLEEGKMRVKGGMAGDGRDAE